MRAVNHVKNWNEDTKMELIIVFKERLDLLGNRVLSEFGCNSAEKHVFDLAESSLVLLVPQVFRLRTKKIGKIE